MKCVQVFENVYTKNAKAEAQLIDIKNRGGLIHPNTLIYLLFSESEKYFLEAIESKKCDIFDRIIDKVIENYKFKFPCEEHTADVY